MIGKLVKYEVKSTIKLFAMFWGALIVISAVVSLLAMVASKTDVARSLLEITSGISMMIYVFIFAAMVVLTIFIIISRFYKGLYGDEGYLMNTLPVKPWQLVTSKGIVATVAAGVGIIVGIISIIIVSVGFSGLPSLSEIACVFREIADAIGSEPEIVLTLLEMFVIFVAGIVKTIYQMYAALSIGQLVNRHRILLALGAYLAITVVLSIIASVAVQFGMMSDINIDATLPDTIAKVNIFFLVIFLLEAVQVAIFHVVSERLTSKHLNLL